MARIRVHEVCRRPLSECDCPPDDDDLEPGAGPQDGSGEDGAAAP